MKSWLVSVALVLAVATALLPRALSEMPDFEVYWRAGHRILAAESLYRVEDGHYQNKYLPVFAAVAAPFALLPLKTAKAVWFYVTVGAILGLIAMSLALLPNRRRSAAALAGLTFVALLKFYAREVNLGQANAVMGVLVLIGFWYLGRHKPVRAAALFAASVVIKPYAIALLPYLLARRSRTASGAFVVFLAGLLFAPAAIYGIAGNAQLLRDWVQTVSASTAPLLLNQDNVSIWAMFAKWFGPGQTATLLAVVSIVVTAAAVLLVVLKRRSVTSPDYLEMAVILTLLPLVSPQGWDYGLLLATSAVMLLVNDFESLPAGAKVVAGTAMGVMAFSVYDLMGRAAYAAFMATSAITVCALILVASLVVLRLRQAPTPAAP